MENGRGEQENQRENAGQNAGHEHIRGDHRNIRQQRKRAIREGGRKKSRQTNSSQAGSRLVNSESVTLLSYGVLLLATPRPLVLTQL